MYLPVELRLVITALGKPEPRGLEPTRGRVVYLLQGSTELKATQWEKYRLHVIKTLERLLKEQSAQAEI